ncbi:unnamed protein product [Rotaria sordida]|uniref:Acyl-ACP thioesterase-like C-terminal domain-containing protein n=1 Tax=Rotaria sordida TaxID=392033 RepID=A0A813W5T2_9BILA|nr:unnamed protein product [Rotaria sordida]CAF0850280.1 unnamed protein product [Rotaria sordida]
MLVSRIIRPYYKLFKREKNIQTRWRDNDIYGHVNNVVYGEWIDSIVNKYLIEKCSLEPLKSPLIGFVVSSHCEYYSPISYPSKISAGLFVKRIEKASAVGGFIHVFVDRINRRPQTINDEMKKQLLSISNIID